MKFIKVADNQWLNIDGLSQIHTTQITDGWQEITAYNGDGKRILIFTTTDDCAEWLVTELVNKINKEANP